MNGRQEVVPGHTSYNRSHTEAALPCLPKLPGRKIVATDKALFRGLSPFLCGLCAGAGAPASKETAKPGTAQEHSLNGCATRAKRL